MERIDASRPPSPKRSTQSWYQGRIRSEMAMMENRCPCRAAAQSAASVIPMTGTSVSSFSAGIPGSPNAATTTPSTLPPDAVAGVLGDDFGDGARRDQGLKTGFDVFDAVPGGPDHEFGSGGGGAEGLRFDQRGDVVADIGVDDKKFHEFFR